jgi:tRNA dimethylallyltransferase
MEQVIVIVGPTCSGKTALSIKIAEKLKTEIISADSRQIYKFLDIGTAKPSQEELNKAKHHFISTLNPDQKFNVSEFEIESIKIINRLHSQQKIPLVVGGSGLYIKSLIDGIFNTVDIDEELREKLMYQRKIHGNEYLYNKLKEVDPVSASRMLPQNYKRIIRAIEVYHLTGKPIWMLQKEYKREINFEFKQYGLNWKRTMLYENIDKRVDDMIESGLVEELKCVLEKGFDKNLNALNTVGYKEIISYLDGEISLERAKELIKRNTRRFAKRQLTWFNKDERINWINIEKPEDLNSAADIILSAVKK